MAARSSSSKIAMNAEPLPGVSAPLGYFDPLGLSKGKSAATMASYRVAELKHGRVAMLAVLGYLTQEKFHPLYGGKLSSNPLEAVTQVPPFALFQIVLFGGILEYLFDKVGKSNDYRPGDYYGLSKGSTDKTWVDFQTRELNNGRLAMFAIMGEMVHSKLTGTGALEQIGL
jgi:hypothetical protein